MISMWIAELAEAIVGTRTFRGFELACKFTAYNYKHLWCVRTHAGGIHICDGGKQRRFRRVFLRVLGQTIFICMTRKMT
jgi:hypothetical protein